MQEANRLRAAAPERLNPMLDDLARRDGPLWLFMDYDGTLAEFSPQPNMLEVRTDVLHLVQDLAADHHYRLAIISGRSLEFMRELLPAEGVVLGGVYGIELQLASGEVVRRGDLGRIRPYLEEVKPAWENLISGQADFFLEDKGWALALHSHCTDENHSGGILELARQLAEPVMPARTFRWFEDEHFLEVAPRRAHKGQAVRYILGHFPFPGAHLLYFGDDDKDEEAFETVHAFGGKNIQVFNPDHPDLDGATDFQLDSPVAVRQWLRKVAGK